ncbi:hypothetical protein Tco_1329261 [Tanacetum coccineum]
MLNVHPRTFLVLQKKRVLEKERSDAITEEVSKLVKARILRAIFFPIWVAKPVMVQKSDNTWRMCIDFTSLNKACPKDSYPLQEIESLEGYKLKCFLDAYKGHHQIRMAKEDEEKTSFHTEHRTFCYDKMPFNLKNVIAASEGCFISKILETFEKLRRTNMKLNPKKCTFGVESGQFLGYMITNEGIKANPKKVQAMIDLTSP